MNINIKKFSENAVIPTYGTEFAAGCDLYANTEGEDVVVRAGSMIKFGTGIGVEIPAGYFGAVFARSGLATKQGLRPANCVGVIDADYRGEIIVGLRNDSGDDRLIHDGDRIAQMIILPYIHAEFTEVDELSETVRGDGGFGSTGVTKEEIPEQMSLFE